MSKQPTLNDLVEIEMLNQKITKLLEQEIQLKEELAISQKNLPLELEDRLKQAIVKEKVTINREAESEIAKKIKSQELNIKSQLATKTLEALNQTLTPAFYQEIVGKVIKQLESKKRDYQILAGKDVAGYLPDKAEYQAAEDGILQIETETQIYILNPKEIRSYLLTEIILNQTSLEN